MQNVMTSRPRLLWGDRVNLFLLLVFQLLAVVVMLSVPLMANRWLKVYPDIPITERWAYLYLPYLLGLVFLITSMWVFSQRRNDGVGQVFSFFATATAIGLFCLFETYTSHQLTVLWAFSVAFSGGALVNLALIFPETTRINLQYPFLRYLGFLPAGLLILVTLYIQASGRTASEFAIVWLLTMIFVGLALAFFLGSTLVRRFDSPSPIVREQARLILWGSLIAFGPIIGWLCLHLIQPELRFTPLLTLPFAIFPVSLGYTILRYRLLTTDQFLNRAVLYGLLTVIVAFSYALLVSGLGLLFNGLLESHHPFLIGIAVLVLALLINPLRLSLQKRVDSVFYRSREVYQERLQAFSRELTQVSDLENTNQLLRKYVDEALSPSKLYIYIIDESNTYYLALNDEDGRPGSGIRFTRKSAIVQALNQQEATIFLGEGNRLPESLLVDQARLAVIGAQLFIPILGQVGLMGWLALGSRLSGEPYTTPAIDYLESLCDQTSLAFERAQVFAALERRIHEMDTIARVAKGINTTLAFNELLEMFYAQTSTLIPTVDFRITLRDDSGEDFHHVFFISNDKRIPSKEDQSYSFDQRLETEVIRNRQPIVTVDYRSECRRKGILPDTNEILAWMSVPLNAGADTIGAVSLGCRDPSIQYTLDQVNLLQAIADLVAGAIVKARLLEDADRRARQMSTLNDLTRSLTSTLDLDPLLNRILQSAVDILDCEVGSLLLVDQQTGESVFEVATGPVGAELEGQRLPPGVGLVGKAIRSKQAIIENDVRRSEDWFNVDEKTGFSTKDLLVVPLVVKDQVIGVLEILNKNDRTPFNWKDLELITAFAGQAAIAIENARLYTQTDQALAARVDELSTLQRIDRELNANLDVERVLDITLEWALRRSEADAGLISIVVDGSLRVMAARGYGEEYSGHGVSRLNTVLPDFKDIIEGGETQHVLKVASKTDEEENHSGSIQPYTENHLMREVESILPHVKTQMIIPINRDSQVIGLILLESISDTIVSEDIQIFLTRLSDHAAIAISNAQLYAEVQKANRAKSQFVSAAAHELKNPLTSIKGYSDLLESGSVGPVSDGQAKFLKTIRSNADRMGTLVSDLQDISRIEAGQMHLEFSNVSFVEVTEEVVRTLKKQIEEEQQTLITDFSETMPHVWCDNTRLIQIMTNLVSNAHKYSPTGGQIVIHAEPVQNQWDSEGAEQVIHVLVSDTGIGISSEDQEMIFQQFFRSEDPRVRDSTGTGLGLSITKRLVEMQGGRIWFESELDQGTEFHFTMPVSEVD
jgi:signal transduction histidine kinase